MSVFQCSKFSAADISAINAGCCTGQLRFSILNCTASSKELAGLKAFSESRAALAEKNAKKYWNSAKVLISITSVAIAGLCAVGSIYGTVLFAAGYALSACGLLGYLGFVYYDAKCAIEMTKSRNFKQIALDAAYKKPSLLSPCLLLSKCRQQLTQFVNFVNNENALVLASIFMVSVSILTVYRSFKVVGEALQIIESLLKTRC